MKKIMSVFLSVILSISFLVVLIPSENLIVEAVGDFNYTQENNYLTPSYLTGSDSWVAYNVTDEDNFPKNCVLEIWARNREIDTPYYVGVREYGNTTDRRLLLHEAEPPGASYGGQTVVRYIVQADGEGMIEVYDDTADDMVRYFLYGYWEDLTWVDLWETIQNNGSDDSWEDFDALTDFGIPAESVMLATLVNNDYNTEHYMGVRTNGSSLDNRRIAIHEAEPSGVDAYTLFVKSDSFGYIETYDSDVSQNEIIIQGYFLNSQVDFVELDMVDVTVAGSGWQDVDLSAYLDQDDRHVDMTGMVFATDASTWYGIGFREENSVLLRSISVHEQESGGETGFSMSVESDDEGLISVNSDSMYITIYINGYFVPVYVEPEFDYFITFRNGGNGDFYQNDTLRADQTEQGFGNGDSLYLFGEADANYHFENFTWSVGSSFSNNYTYSVNGDATIWVYFEINNFTITFYQNDAGSFYQNDTLRGNSTSIIFDYGTELYLFGDPDAHYKFDNFTWSGGSSDSNNYTYTVTQENSLWCFFRNIKNRNNIPKK